ncbi:thioesterase domain-containing protein [Shigella flexneri]
MVSSTVGQLQVHCWRTATTAQAQRLGYEPLLPLRNGDGQTLFCFHPASGLPGSSACCRAICRRAGGLPAFSRRARKGRCRVPRPLDEVCEHHLVTLLPQQPHGPSTLLGYSLGGCAGAHRGAFTSVR